MCGHRGHSKSLSALAMMQLARAAASEHRPCLHGDARPIAARGASARRPGSRRGCTTAAGRCPWRAGSLAPDVAARVRATRGHTASRAARGTQAYRTRDSRMAHMTARSAPRMQLPRRWRRRRNPQTQTAPGSARMSLGPVIAIRSLPGWLAWQLPRRRGVRVRPPSASRLPGPRAWPLRC